MSMFSAPSAPSDGLTWADHKGRLLLIDVLGLEASIETSFGESSAVRANVTILDGDDAGVTFDDALVFPKVLQSQLRSQVGQKVLGRLNQGNAKPGKSAPWLLDEATPEDVTVAEAWVAKSAPAFTKADAPY